MGGGCESEPLQAAPRWIISLTVHSHRVLSASLVLFVASSIGGMVRFWPIVIDEDFESYLQCDGPQNGRYKALRSAREAEKAADQVAGRPRRLLDQTSAKDVQFVGGTGIDVDWDMDAAEGLSTVMGRIGHAAADVVAHPAAAGGHIEGRRLAAERSTLRFFIRVIYATPDGGNIFVPETLYRIREVERRIQSLSGYGDLCFSSIGGSCESPLSAINFFFASSDPKTGAIIPDGRGTELLPVPAILASLGAKNTYFVDRYFGVAKGATQAALEGNITRSVFRFGLPLRGFASPDDRRQDQEAIFKSFVVHELFPYLHGEASSPLVQVYYYGDLITSYEVEATVWHDATYAIGSLVFIFCYLVGHLRSVWLAVDALFCITLSFPLTYITYCFVYGHGKMIAINFLSLFVVLGVGADDVFVLNDVWVLSRAHGSGEMALARRLWSMYRKAGLAIFATSATTAASFFANLASSIGPLRQFGFFMGACISVNWIIVATLFPLFLVGYDRSRSGSRRVNPLSSELPDGAAEMEERLVGSTPVGMEKAYDAEADAPANRVDDAWGKQARCAPGLIFLLLSISASGVGLPAAAVIKAVRDLRPASEIPQFFPQKSNLGALQELQKRFGNESGVSSVTGLQLCRGQIRSEDDCKRLAQGSPSPSPPTVAPIAFPPLAPLPATTQPPTPWPVVRKAQDVEVDLAVSGHTALEVDGMRSVIAWTLADALGVSRDDIEVNIGPGNMHAVAPVTWRRRLSLLGAGAVGVRPLQDAPPLRRRRLVQLEENEVGRDIAGGPGDAPLGLVVRFHGLSPERRADVQRFLANKAELARLYDQFGVLNATLRQVDGGQPQRPGKLPPPATTPVPGVSWTPSRLPSTAQPLVAWRPPPPLLSTPPVPAWRPPPPLPSTPPVPAWRPPPPLPSTPAPGTEPPSQPGFSGLSVQHEAPRALALDRSCWVTVMLGFKPSGVSGGYELDDSFDMRAPAAQAALVELCDRISTEPQLKVMHIECWPQDFRQFLRQRRVPFPSQNFDRDMQLFFRAMPVWQNNVGLHRAKGVASGVHPAWVALRFRTEFDTHSSGRSTQPFMERWEAVLSEQSAHIARGDGKSLGAAVACTDLFVRAEAELRVIGSALSSWVVSVFCALAAVVVFTRSLFLSSTVVFAIFATSACSLFAIVEVFRWSFGLMEAVSLIIFCGFSVDYPLHVVQAFVNERCGGASVREALREIAGAVGSGCATTCGAAVFLLLCEIRIFTRFGQVLIVNMLFALLFALVWIPALLELQGRCFGFKSRDQESAVAGTPASSTTSGASLSPLAHDARFSAVPGSVATLGTLPPAAAGGFSPDGLQESMRVAAGGIASRLSGFTSLRSPAAGEELQEAPAEGFIALSGGTPRGERPAAPRQREPE